MGASAMQTLLDARTRFLAFVVGRVKDRAAAEDILQLAYMRALEHAGELRDQSVASAWFYSVLRNAIIDHHRRLASEFVAVDGFARELGLEEVEGDLTRHQPEPTFVCGCIAQVLPTLRPAYAEILREVDLGGLPLNDYAKRHQMTAGNAGVRAHRARAALRRELVRTCGSCSIQACLDCVCRTSSEALEE
jgi:RNA polymerase sigma-70 factor (ECF subfamily)